jgi:lauroyl/myristoyl acyltransferase
MERLILARPEQYLWSYNRYKVPPGDTGAMPAEDRQ